jgi:probable HAF family extracellular repeat protein
MKMAGQMRSTTMAKLSALSALRGLRTHFSCRNRQIIDLGALINASEISSGSGINDLGEIVGAHKISSGVYAPFLYRDSSIETLDASGGHGDATDINDRGQIVGFMGPVPGQFRAFLFQDRDVIDLGASMGQQSQALGINNRGQIVGFGPVPDGGNRAFLYEDGSIKYLSGGARSAAFGINDAGEILGQSMDNDQLPIAFLWTPTIGLLICGIKFSDVEFEHCQVTVRLGPKRLAGARG